MRYPQANNFLRYKRVSYDTYEVSDVLSDSIWEMNTRAVYFLQNLNGHTSPEEVLPDISKEEVNDLLTGFENAGLLRDGRVTSLGLGNLMIAIWIPKIQIYKRKYMKLANSLLLILFIPTFLLGSILYFEKYCCSIFIPEGDSSFVFLTATLFGALLGLLVHELSHFMAAIGYGARAYEIGIAFHNFLPGAYVALEKDKITKRRKLFQIDAAGIESNIMLAGIFLIVDVSFNCKNMFFTQAALINTIIAVVNLSFLKGLDGLNIISDILGTEDILHKAISVMSKRRDKIVKRNGISGYALIWLSYMIIFFQLMIPIVIIVELLSLFI